jgi:hypothetical protein
MRSSEYKYKKKKEERKTRQTAYIHIGWLYIEGNSILYNNNCEPTVFQSRGDYIDMMGADGKIKRKCLSIYDDQRHSGSRIK